MIVPSEHAKQIVPSEHAKQAVRLFGTGASRDTSEGKLSYGGFFSARVLRRRAQYMEDNRTLEDGGLRAPDNWKKGMPTGVYMDSLFRHFWDIWAVMTAEAGDTTEPVDIEEALCALMFNAEGLLFEILKVDEGWKAAEERVRREHELDMEDDYLGQVNRGVEGEGWFPLTSSDNISTSYDREDAMSDDIREAEIAVEMSYDETDTPFSDRE